MKMNDAWGYDPIAETDYRQPVTLGESFLAHPRFFLRLVSYFLVSVLVGTGLAWVGLMVVFLARNI